MTETVPTTERGIPFRYWVWLVTASWTSLGTQVLAFALAWSAAAIDPGLAGLLIATAAAPRLGLVLLGGSLADRFGAARVLMIAATSAIGVATVVVLRSERLLGTPVTLLAVSAALGTVSAFTIPASGALPRLLVHSDALPRALAARQVTHQMSTVLAPTLAGVVVAAGGLTAAALAEVAGATAMLLLMTALRLRRPTPPQEASDSLGRHMIGGLRIVAGDGVFRTLTLALVAVAGFLLPVTSLLIPLVAHAEAWGPKAAGLLAATYTGGSIVAGIVVLAAPRASRPGVVAGASLVLAATGIALLGLATGPAFAVGGCAVAGLGTGSFTAQVAPVLLGRAPESHVARVQAVLVIAQTAPLLVTSAALGSLADLAGAHTAAHTCAAGALTAGIGVLLSRDLRAMVSDRRTVAGAASVGGPT